MKNFANIISQKRKELGLTQDALAEKLGITPQAISKWENGVGLPDVTLFPAIAKVLGVSTDALFGIDHTQKELSPREFPAEYAGLTFIGCENGIACYSDKTAERHEDGSFFFTDGSSADLHEKKVVNRGAGEIRLLEEDAALTMQRFDAECTAMEKSLDKFSSIIADLALHCDFCMMKSDSFRIEAEGSKTFIESIRAELEGDVLKLTVRPPKNHYARHREDNKITLYAGFEKGEQCSFSINGSSGVVIEPDFEEMNLSINGSGDVSGKNADSLQAKINGSGDIALDTAKTAVLLINGSGDIDIKAVTESTEAKINGSGDVDLGEAKNTTLRIAGSGDVVIGHATGDLNATINGSGDIEVGGEVEAFTCTIAGSGDIHGDKLSVQTAEITTKGDSGATIVIGHIKGVSTEKIGKNATLVVKKRG